MRANVYIWLLGVEGTQNLLNNWFGLSVCHMLDG